MLQRLPLVRVLIAFIVGILAGANMEMNSFWGLIVAAFSCVLSVILFKKYQFFKSILLFFPIVLIGIVCMVIQKRELNVGFSGKTETFEALIVSDVQFKSKTYRCDLLVLSGRLRGKKLKAYILRRSGNRHVFEPKISRAFGGAAIFEPIEGWRKSSNFDYVRWMQVQGYAGKVFILPENIRPEVVRLDRISDWQRVRLWARKTQKRLSERYKSLGLTGQNYAIMTAMTLGDKTMLEKETKEIYSETGASHVLALSGLHLGILVGILMVFFGGKRRFCFESLSLTLVAIWMYVLLTGMSASILRSAIMFTVYVFSFMLNRQSSSLNSLALAAFVLLIVNPLSLWDVSFQMSFMAVLSIVLFYQPLHRLLPDTRFANIRAVKRAWALAVISMVSQIGVAPLVAYYFGRFPVYFLLTNFLVIPCAYIILYGAVLLFVLMPFMALQYGVAKGLSFVVSLMTSGLEWISGLPGACIENIRLNGLQVLLIYFLTAVAGMLICHLRPMMHGKTIR